MNFHDYLRIARRSWFLIIGAVILCTGVAGLASVLTAPKYAAVSEVYVSVQSADTQAGALVQGSTFARQAVQSYVSLVNKEIVLSGVIEELDLTATPAQLAGSVTATNPTNTVLIEISAVDADPERAAAVANSVATNLRDVVVDDLEKPEGAAASPVQIEVIQTALVPASPVSPRPMLNLALGALIGFAVGIGVAMLRELLDTRVRTPHDIEALTDVSIIGRIAFDPESDSRPLVVHADPLSPRAESFRSLRTNVRFIDATNDNHSFVVTSSVPSEGKTTVAANLAITLAEQGARVVLVDADLRRPSIASVLGLEGTVGLTDLLVGRATLDDVMQRWGRRQLHVLPAGTIPPNPSELLGSKRMSDLHDELLQFFDYVIFDVPPALSVTDAAVLSEIANGVLVVVASGLAQKSNVAAVFRQFEAIDAPISGVIVNMVPTKGPDAYAYGVYAHKYYGGGNDDESPDALVATLPMMPEATREASSA